MFIRALLLSLLFSAHSVAASEPHFTFALGQQTGTRSAEAQLRYSAEPLWRNVQPMLGASLAANGSAWIGGGAGITWRAATSGVFVRVSSMAGLYRQGNGPDLGGALQFRSALDLGLRSARGVEYGVGTDHRSNAGIKTPNPGLNTIYVFVTVPKG